MVVRKGRRIAITQVVCGIAAALLATLAFADGVAFNVGDVLAAVGSGKVKHFSNTGTLLDTLDTTTGSSYTAGMCFDAAGNLYVTTFASNTVSKFNSAGNLVVANFGSGYNSDNESCAVGSGGVYVGQADGSEDVLKFDRSGTLLANYDVPTGPRGSDWIDLAADNCTLFYTSEGDTIKRYNVCTSTAMADFATAPSGPCYALRIRPNGEVLAACTSVVHRFDSAGTLIKSYPAADYATSDLFALNLDPDGTSFWTGDLTSTGRVVRVDIASGSLITGFNTNASTALAGLAVVGEIRVALASVTYNGNGNTGGAPPTDPNTYSSGQTVTVLGNTGGLTKTGYVFSGWNTAANGSGTTYQPGGTFNMPSNNIVLYAVWVPVAVVVPQTVPTLSQWGWLLLSSLTLGLGIVMLYRRTL
jgi:uncharacterized repeat protein (TIGR02543 family)